MVQRHIDVDEGTVAEIVQAYKSACRRGDVRNAFEVAASSLQQGMPEVPIDKARMIVAEVLSEYDGPPPQLSP